MQLTNSSGSITKQYSYDAFGVEIDKVDSDTNPFRYCGEYFDTETDSIYLRARYYAPVIGRFITEDPICDGLNWYLYCDGNPIEFVDPDGKNYAKVIAALDAIYNSKNVMNHSEIGSARYNRALNNAKINKEIIRNSAVYIENWGELTDILSPLINGVYNSLEDIAEMKAAVQRAESAYKKSSTNDSIIFVVTTATAMVTAVKAGRALLGMATTSAGILPLTTSVDPNKLNHIFGKAEHKLSDFLSSYGGDQTKAYNAIRNAAQIVVNDLGVVDKIYKSTENPIIVNVNGFELHVGGKVINGIFNLGTMFIK